MLVEISFVIVLALVVAAIFWVIVRSSSKKICAQYEKLARQLNVEMTQPEPQLGGFIRPEPFLYGSYRERAMSISVPGKGMQNTRQIETVLKLEVSDKSIKWQMTAKGLLSGMRQRDSGGMEHWTSGDREFDLAIDTRTNEPARLSRLLHETRLDAILKALKESKGSIYLGQGTIVFTRFGLISKDDERELFKQLTDLLCDLAEAIEVTRLD
ncbi:MAG: hypothetical protein ACON4O_05280 [Lentimonas sp.]